MYINRLSETLRHTQRNSARNPSL